MMIRKWFHRFSYRLLSLLGPLFSLIGEGNFKQRIRLVCFRIRNSLPACLMVNKGDTVVQVGTPNAQTMQHYCDLVGADGRLVIIEAEPGNIATLQKASKKLRHQNVTIVPKGAWSQRSTVLLSLGSHKGDHKVEIAGVSMDNDFKPENTYEQEVTIEVDTVDALLKELSIDAVDYLNVTVNGAELEVLKGCSRVLNSPGIRVWVKGHAKLADGTALNAPIQQLLRENGLSTHLTAKQPSVGSNLNWLLRDGDVYGYRQ